MTTQQILHEIDRLGQNGPWDNPWFIAARTLAGMYSREKAISEMRAKLADPVAAEGTGTEMRGG